MYTPLHYVSLPDALPVVKKPLKKNTKNTAIINPKILFTKNIY